MVDIVIVPIPLITNTPVGSAIRSEYFVPQGKVLDLMSAKCFLQCGATVIDREVRMVIGYGNRTVALISSGVNQIANEERNYNFLKGGSNRTSGTLNTATTINIGHLELPPGTRIAFEATNFVVNEDRWSETIILGDFRNAQQ